MSYTLFSEAERTARKPHRCIWCGERIDAGQRYIDERSVYDGRMQNHKWHPECLDDAHAGWAAGDDNEFIPHSAPRPPSAAALEFASWDCALLAQGRLEFNGATLNLAGHQYQATDLLQRAVRNIHPGRAGLAGVFWSKVRDAFAVGSSVACDLCRWAGLDPNTGRELPASTANPCQSFQSKQSAPTIAPE